MNNTAGSLVTCVYALDTPGHHTTFFVLMVRFFLKPLPRSPRFLESSRLGAAFSVLAPVDRTFPC
ncbi:hypothetical protein CSUI_010614 [Cystoisospora suis]|uniref:Uncharacterized protein n=1 Tax=Cystoisospora suis TaxID=483139 RepID=A0A2C6KD47_9APIC|nr:hypothetical protein CSUI_010614 [Cystoisospora suis]